MNEGREAGCGRSVEHMSRASKELRLLSAPGDTAEGFRTMGGCTYVGLWDSMDFRPKEK